MKVFLPHEQRPLSGADNEARIKQLQANLATLDKLRSWIIHTSTSKTIISVYRKKEST